MRKTIVILLGGLLLGLTASAQEVVDSSAVVPTDATNSAQHIAEAPQSAPIQHPADSLATAEAQPLVSQHYIHSSAQEAIEKYLRQTSPRKSYQGYRIRIFASHTQSARTDAEAAMALFREHYSVPLYFAYENPYFLVTCGNCLTQEEAIMLLSKVRIHFPKAFIVTTEIPAELFTTPPAPPAPETTEEGESEVSEVSEVKELRENSEGDAGDGAASPAAQPEETATPLATPEV
ncbi:MAG: hypothetical protein J6V28_04490 [Tidjanibacter sp.]|nr:hypothetical protein [Tidjanibacter sp.]